MILKKKKKKKISIWSKFLKAVMQVTPPPLFFETNGQGMPECPSLMLQVIAQSKFFFSEKRSYNRPKKCPKNTKQR